METNPKISTASDALCELCKCGVGLEINEKQKENIKSCQKTKTCDIRKRSTFGRIDECGKGICKHKKNF